MGFVFDSANSVLKGRGDYIHVILVNNPTVKQIFQVSRIVVELLVKIIAALYPNNTL